MVSSSCRRVMFLNVSVMSFKRRGLDSTNLSHVSQKGIDGRTQELEQQRDSMALISHVSG